MHEKYRPTALEKQQIKILPGLFKVSGDGVFATRQGEGLTAGSKAVFLRLQLCNLACGLQSGWKCDTAYAWNRRLPEFWQEPYNLTYAQAATKIEDVWDTAYSDDRNRRLVVTGGEPLIQHDGIVQLKELLPGWQMEIETNGTIFPHPELSDVQFNCSPKLSNSGNSESKRFRPKVLRAISDLPNSFFKFVVVSKDDFAEIERIVADCHIPAEKVLIMPEGHTPEEVTRKSDLLVPEVTSRGWLLAMRNHLIWYGPKRRT